MSNSQITPHNSLGNIGIIGNGSWGTALAKMLTDNGHTIRWWLRNESAVQHLQNRHHNPNYLTSVTFAPNAIKPTSNLAEVLESCDSIVFAVPSAYALEVLNNPDAALLRKKIVLSAIKGILPESNRLLSDYLQEKHDFNLERYIAITGPCHAEEVANERLSYLTFSSLDEGIAEVCADTFANDYIRTSFNHDIWGAQFAAVLKNIYAIGAGMAHALDYGDNFLSVYITACYREMYRFLKKHFKKIHPSDDKPDFHTSAYLGDLLVTCYSLHSRNRRFGTMLGKGYSIQAAILEMNMVAEGYYASRGMQAITKQYKLKTPIADKLYSVMWEGANPMATFQELAGMIF